jgi:hypothetical protein
MEEKMMLMLKSEVWQRETLESVKVRLVGLELKRIKRGNFQRKSEKNSEKWEKD